MKFNKTIAALAALIALVGVQSVQAKTTQGSESGEPESYYNWMRRGAANLYTQATDVARGAYAQYGQPAVDRAIAATTDAANKMFAEARKQAEIGAKEVARVTKETGMKIAKNTTDATAKAFQNAKEVLLAELGKDKSDLVDRVFNGDILEKIFNAARAPIEEAGAKAYNEAMEVGMKAAVDATEKMKEIGKNVVQKAVTDFSTAVQGTEAAPMPTSMGNTTTAE